MYLEFISASEDFNSLPVNLELFFLHTLILCALKETNQIQGTFNCYANWCWIL